MFFAFSRYFRSNSLYRRNIWVKPAPTKLFEGKGSKRLKIARSLALPRLTFVDRMQVDARWPAGAFREKVAELKLRLEREWRQRYPDAW